MDDFLAVEQKLLAELVREIMELPYEDLPDWRSLHHRLAGVDVTRGLLAEHELDRAAETLRSLLLRRAHAMSEQRFRSPDTMLRTVLPSGCELDHSYERNMTASHLEARLAAAVAEHVPTGWALESVAFSSGMAALTHVLQSLIHMMHPTEAHPLKIAYWGDYFETDLLLEYLASSAVSHEKIPPSALTDPASFSGADVLLVEPVRYSRTLDVLPLRRWLRAWAQDPARPRVVIADTTLISPAWPMRQVLEAMAGRDAVTFIEVRSALKLDQQGLELANLGVANVLHHQGMVGGVPRAGELAKVLRLVRGVTGAGPSAADIAALDAPFLFRPAWHRRHAGQVYANNRYVAERLATVSGVFSSVVHPSLASENDIIRDAPFVIIELAEDSAEDSVANHGFVLGVLRHAAAIRGIRLVHGASFGFRSHRFDAVIPRVSRPRGLLKFAAGSRRGPFLDAAADILAEIGRVAGMDALRALYPDVKEIPLLPPEADAEEQS
ncbi:hypothetical protein ACIHFD_63740 [Nonomuraea sp. NPDC051941]|uniref:hypothetical protein n=1 Tax=Nonomuraea sp. NPDC051941 TaxID=3364373 RepID=UPI0037C66934